MKHIEGSGGKPDQYPNDEEKAKGKISEEFSNWEQQDQLLASMSENLITRIVGCEFSHQIWKKLEVFFASQSRAKINQLKTQLKTTKKTGSVNDFLLNIKRIVDTLAAVGAPINVEDHIEAIFNGLSCEYDPFITSVMTRIEPYSVEDIGGLAYGTRGTYREAKT